MIIKSTLREIRTSLARYLAIFAIVALGVGFFSGLKVCKACMTKTADTYLKEHGMYDYVLMSSYGIDDESVRIAEAEDGVTGAEGSVQIDVMAAAVRASGDGDEPGAVESVETDVDTDMSGDDTDAASDEGSDFDGGSGADTGKDASASDMALRAISLPERINTVNLVSGRMPERMDECVADDYSMESEGFKVGDRIILSDNNDKDRLEDFKCREFKVVGTVNSPIYLDYQRGSTDIGNGSLNSFFYVDKSALDVDYYTHLYLTLAGGEQFFTDEKEAAVDAEEDRMEDLAERITAARRETAMAKAQKKLDKKIREYEEKLADYEAKKADAIRELDDASAKLDKGQKKLNSERSKARKARTDIGNTIDDLGDKLKEAETGIIEAETAIADLKTKKSSVKSGISQIKSQLAELEQAHEAGMIDDEAYAAGKAQLDGAMEELRTNEAAIDEGLSRARSGLAEAKAGKKKIKQGLSQAGAGKKKIDSGLRTIDREQKKLNSGRSTLRKERGKAYREFAKAEKKLADAKEKLDDAQRKIDEMETGNSYAVSVYQDPGYSAFNNNSDIVSNVAKVFPVFFFLIAALVCMTTMTRMVDEQRTQIGVLKALGYSNASIVGKYLFYSGSAAFLGGVIGFFTGCKVFPVVVWKAYGMMYDFTGSVEFVLDVKLGLIALACALICSMGATWLSISQDFRVSPSELIRPKTPPAGKRILLERITPVWDRISFLYKVSFRNVFRDKKRFLMMVVGVSGCTALLMAGMGIGSSVAEVADHQFDEISLYDFRVIFNKNMTKERQDHFRRYMSKKAGVSADEIMFVHQAEATLMQAESEMDVTLTAADGEGFGRFTDLHTGEEPLSFQGDGEAVIVKNIAREYDLAPGDTIRIRDGYREGELTVSGVCDNYMYDTVYVSTDTYEKVFGCTPEIKSALIRLMPDGADAGSGAEGSTADAEDESGANGAAAREADFEAASEDEVRAAATAAANYKYSVAVTVNLDIRNSVARMMESLNLVTFVIILSAALLAFIVLYNLTNITITERIREIATIKVLGFNQFEVSQYVFRENLFMTAIAALVGIPVGKWLLTFAVDNAAIKMLYFEARFTNTDVIEAVALTFLFSILVNLVMMRRLRNVSMTESLKSIE